MPELQQILQQLSAGRARLESISGSIAVPDSDELMAEIAHLTEQLLVADEELRVQDEELGDVRRRLATANERWEHAFASAPVPYLLTDANGIVINTNAVARDLLGEPPGSTRVRPIASKFSMTDRQAIRELIRVALLEGSAQAAGSVRRPDGETVPVQVSAVSVEMEDEGERFIWWHLVPQTSVPQMSVPQMSVPQMSLGEPKHRSGLDVAGLNLALLVAGLAAQDDVAAVAARAAELVCALDSGVQWALVYLRTSATGPAAQLVAASGLDVDSGVPSILDIGVSGSAVAEEHRSAGRPDVVALPLARDGEPTEGLLVVGLGSELDRSSADFVREAAKALGNQIVVVRRLANERERVANLSVALESNRRIGAALGILMARHKITDTQAFELLRTASQRRHVKLRDLADDVVLTGELSYSPKDSGTHVVVG